VSTSTIPSVVERRVGGGERVVDVFSRLLTERIVYLGTEIDDGVANVLVAQLLHLESEDPDAPIDLYINSPGGSTSAALAVYDAMQYVRPVVATTCVGQAASPAALLLAGGAPGRRAILAHGRVVLHQPSAEGRGTLPDLIVAADEIGRVRRQLEEVLARHTGKDVATVRRDTDRDLVLPAEAAVAYGVADHVLRDRGPRAAGLS
jgi:ATP-dependent Clp protease, protease subunit